MPTSTSEAPRGVGAGPASASAADLKAWLAAEAAREGFVGFGTCRPDAIPEARARLRAFLEAGHHGQMAWMEEREAWRADPAALWPAARSVVMLADSYAPDHDPLAVLAEPTRAGISVYAQRRDYHDRLKPRLKRLLRGLLARAPSHEGPPEGKVFVDTAPVMEKPLAQAAGLGWQGKHTNLLGRAFGNWVFLGAILTTVDLPPDAPERSRCGSCTRCLDACPTDAFPAPYRLDATRCLAYYSIEHRGPIPEPFRTLMGNRVYGCDDCLAVCPWNKFAQGAHELLAASGPPEAPPLAELAALDEAAFRARFAGTPVRRLGRDRLLRNVLYAIGNAGDLALAPHAAAHRDAPDPAVAEAARWALDRLSPRPSALAPP